MSPEPPSSILLYIAAAAAIVVVAVDDDDGGGVWERLMGRGGRGRGREVLGRCDGCEEKGEGGLVRTCRMSRGRSAELREGGSETTWAGSSPQFSRPPENSGSSCSSCSA